MTFYRLVLLAVEILTGACCAILFGIEWSSGSLQNKVLVRAALFVLLSGVLILFDLAANLLPLSGLPMFLELAAYLRILATLSQTVLLLGYLCELNIRLYHRDSVTLTRPFFVSCSSFFFALFLWIWHPIDSVLYFFDEEGQFVGEWEQVLILSLMMLGGIFIITEIIHRKSQLTKRLWNCLLFNGVMFWISVPFVLFWGSQTIFNSSLAVGHGILFLNSWVGEQQSLIEKKIREVENII